MRFWHPSYFSPVYWARKFWPGLPAEPVGEDATPTNIVPLEVAIEEFSKAEEVGDGLIRAEAFRPAEAKKTDTPEVRNLQ